jgi:hypothetical protein
MTRNLLLTLLQQRTAPTRRTCQTGLERVLSPTCPVLDAVCLNAVDLEIAVLVAAVVLEATAQVASNEVETSSLLVLTLAASVENEGAHLHLRVMVKLETSATGSERVLCHPYLVQHPHREMAAEREPTMGLGNRDSPQQQVGVRVALEPLLKEVLKMDRAHHVANFRIGHSTTDSQPLLNWTTNGEQKCAPMP